MTNVATKIEFIPLKKSHEITIEDTDMEYLARQKPSIPAVRKKWQKFADKAIKMYKGDSENSIEPDIDMALNYAAKCRELGYTLEFYELHPHTAIGIAKKEYIPF